MQVKDIKRETSLRLYCHLLMTPAEDVLMSFTDAAALLGIKSQNAFIAARRELVELGVVSVERQKGGFVFRLLAASSIPEPEMDTWETEAARIEAMPEEGSRHDPYSPIGQKRKAQIRFLQRVYGHYFPGTDPVTVEMCKAWLRATCDVRACLEKIQDISLRKKVDSPPSYILGALKGNGTPPPPRPTPEPKKPAWLPANQDFRTEEEAREYWRAHPDPEVERFKKLMADGKLKPRKPKWQVTGDEEEDDAG